MSQHPNERTRKIVYPTEGSRSGLAGRAGASGILAALLIAMLVLLPARARARASAAGQVSVGISVSFGPPPLPVYAQPMCPGPGYIWTPGYWAWDPDGGYYWVPGTWVMAPFAGALWTPGYWGWDPVVVGFVWHRGYWGTTVGFYGGINYGFGYFGEGYDGGYWRRGVFFYNRAVNHVNVINITHIYYRNKFHHRYWNRDRDRISYNGGRGGIHARPTRHDFRAERERRMGPVRAQERHQRFARRMPEARWSHNHGRPRIAATSRPERFNGRGVEHATRAGGPYRWERQARPRSREWHSFGDHRSGRDQSRQPGYRDMGRQGNRSQQRPDHARERMRPQQDQHSGWRQQRQQRQQRPQQDQHSGWRQQRQQRQQPEYRGGRQRQQQQREQARPGNRQQIRQPQRNWNRQQRTGSEQARRPTPEGQRSNSARQPKSKPNGEQGKRGKPHSDHHHR